MEEMIVQCCVCRKYRENERWIETPPISDPACPVSHTYCPPCAERLFEEIRKECEEIAAEKPARIRVFSDAPSDAPDEIRMKVPAGTESI